MSGLSEEAIQQARSRRPLPLADAERFALRAQHLHQPARNDVGRLLHIAAHQQRRVDRALAVKHAHGEGARGAVLVEQVEVGLNRRGAIARQAHAQEVGGWIAGVALGEHLALLGVRRFLRLAQAALQFGHLGG